MPVPLNDALGPVELLQRLVRFDTTNPPGYERACVSFLDELLRGAGFETVLVAKDPERPNLITRLAGRGEAPPLLLYGHVDVVTTADQAWTHPPFAAEIADGFVWGRGTLDMKGGVAMLVSALLQAKREGARPAGDIVLAILSDEEAGGDFGARFLVEKHAELFAGVRYALGEFGAFTQEIGGRRFYPIQVAEKQLCWLRATARGPAGHAARPIAGGAMAKMGRFLAALDRLELPAHITPVVRARVEAMARALGPGSAVFLRALLVPALTGRVLRLLGPRARGMAPWFRHTVSPTIVRGGEQINVIPSRVTAELDARILPGFRPNDLLRELRQALGSEVELEVVRFDEGPAEADLGLFDLLAGVLRRSDPGCVPVPMLMPAVTDGRHFARLGIQTYGFLPMKLPAGFDLLSTLHAADERIPVEAVEAGTRLLRETIGLYAMQ